MLSAKLFHAFDGIPVVLGRHIEHFCPDPLLLFQSVKRTADRIVLKRRHNDPAAVDKSVYSLIECKCRVRREDDVFRRASDERAYSLPAAVYSFCRMYCRFMTAAPGITADFHCVLYCVNNRSGFRKTRCGVVKIYHIHLSSV